jgi:hypothetical protein
MFHICSPVCQAQAPPLACWETVVSVKVSAVAAANLKASVPVNLLQSDAGYLYTSDRFHAYQKRFSGYLESRLERVGICHRVRDLGPLN